MADIVAVGGPAGFVKLGVDEPAGVRLVEHDGAGGGLRARLQRHDVRDWRLRRSHLEFGKPPLGLASRGFNFIEEIFCRLAVLGLAGRPFSALARLAPLHELLAGALRSALTFTNRLAQFFDLGA